MRRFADAMREFGENHRKKALRLIVEDDIQGARVKVQMAAWAANMEAKMIKSDIACRIAERLISQALIYRRIGMALNAMGCKNGARRFYMRASDALDAAFEAAQADIEL